jgi:hypothetical protein
MDASEHEWNERLSRKHWSEWDEEERAYFRQKQEQNPVDPRFAELYAKLCHALEAIRLEILEPTAETGVADFDDMAPLVSDWSRKTANGVLRVLLGPE